MYRTRQQIDDILTKEQLAEMRACLAKDCKKNKSKDKAVAPTTAGDLSNAPADKPRQARRKWPCSILSATLYLPYFCYLSTIIVDK